MPENSDHEIVPILENFLTPDEMRTLDRLRKWKVDLVRTKDGKLLWMTKDRCKFWAQRSENDPEEWVGPGGPFDRFLYGIYRTIEDALDKAPTTPPPDYKEEPVPATAGDVNRALAHHGVIEEEMNSADIRQLQEDVERLNAENKRLINENSALRVGSDAREEHILDLIRMNENHKKVISMMKRTEEDLRKEAEEKYITIEMIRKILA